jgi:hypothetical protein
MTGSPLYLPMLLPQWGIFAGVVLIIVGYVDKKKFWTLIGWAVLIITSLTALYFNLFGGLNTLADSNGPDSNTSLLILTGWQTVAGGVPAIVSLLMLQFKKRRYPLLAILTLIYFILTFFLYYQVSGSSWKKVKTVQKSEQTNKNL